MAFRGPPYNSAKKAHPQTALSAPAVNTCNGLKTGSFPNPAFVQLQNVQKDSKCFVHRTLQQEGNFRNAGGASIHPILCLHHRAHHSLYIQTAVRTPPPLQAPN